jgi:ankyrin repeat protein
MTSTAKPTANRVALYTRIIVFAVLVFILRDAYLRRKAANLSLAISRNDWQQAKALIGPGTRFVDEAEEVHAFRMASVEDDSQVLDLLVKHNAVYPDLSKTSREGLLFESLELGRKAAVFSLVKAGVSVNTVTEFGSALQRATFSNQVELENYLKAHGAHYLPGEAAVNGDAADLEAGFASGFKPSDPIPAYLGDGTYLTVTARNGHAETLKLLLAHGADINARCKSSDPTRKEWVTALHAAAESGNAACVEALVKAGIGVNVRGSSSKTATAASADSTGSTPLMVAAAAGNADTVAELLKLKADPSISLPDGRNALSLAVSGAAMALAANAAPPPSLTAGPAPMPAVSAAKTDLRSARIKLIRTLIGINPKLAASTPGLLASASAAGLLELVPELAEKGAAINGSAGKLSPPLIAVMQGRTTANLPSAQSQTLAETTAIALISRGADVNGADQSGITPLMAACFYNLPRAVDAILAKGGSLTATDKRGKTVKDYAFSAAGKVGAPSESRAELVAVLKRHGIQMSFLEALQFDSLADVTEMLAKGADPNQTFVLSGKEIPGYEAQYTVPANRASTGKMVALAVSSLSAVTPLMLAAGSGYLDIMKLLLAHHADVKATDSRGWTALANAAEYNQVEAAKLLIANGAAIESRDKRQWTVLMIAAGAGAIDCVKLLVEAGADIEAKDVNGFTPLARASTAGSIAVVQYLIDRHANVNATNSSGKGMIYLARNRHHDNVVDLLRKYHALEQAAPDNTIPQK